MQGLARGPGQSWSSAILASSQEYLEHGGRVGRDSTKVLFPVTPVFAKHRR